MEREYKKGTYTSVWDGGTQIDTPATLDVELGWVETEAVEVSGVNNLDEEYFTDEEGNRYDICPNCGYVIRDVMFEHEGELGEKICSNPHCGFKP